MKSLLLVLLFSVLSFAATKEKPLALVWKGKGTCFMWCAPSAKKMAKMAGYRTKFVTNKTKNIDELLEQASMWVQPGGQSIQAAKDMGVELLDKVRSFVGAGGGYVGFCAGMLLATNRIGEAGGDGLGIIPGETVHLFSDEEDRPYVLDIELKHFGSRKVYFSGGPYLVVNKDEEKKINVLAKYDDGKIAAIETSYGKGKVSVAGYHPETPEYWKKLRGKKDEDKSDYFLAVQMMKSVKKVQD